MSTRCQIEFKHVYNYLKRKRPIIERRTVYRHSDGYPGEEGGVINTLKQFLKWNGGRNSDIEYQTANFIYWSKRWFEERYFNKDSSKKIEDKNLKWSDCGSTNVSTLHTGFGVCENDGFHGDIAYFYEVVREVTELEKHKYKTETKILVYTPEDNWRNGKFDKPLKRENLKLIKTVKIKQETPEGTQVIAQPSI